MLSLTRPTGSVVYTDGPVAVFAYSRARIGFDSSPDVRIRRAEQDSETGRWYADAHRHHAQQLAALALVRELAVRSDLPPDIARAVRDILTGGKS